MRRINQANEKASPVVLHIVQSLRGGGAESFVRELIPSLTRRAIDARVLCAYGDSRLTDDEIRDWMGILYSQQRGGMSRFQYLDGMRRTILRIAPDIVHTHTHVGATWGRMAAILARAPLIVHTEHRSVNRLPILERVAETLLNRRTDALIVFSERTAQTVRLREWTHNVRIIPNGIRILPAPTEDERRAARQELEFDGSSIVIGIVANLFPHKNLSVAIDAIASISQATRKSLRLAFFGDGPLRENLMAHARGLGVLQQVRFFGFCVDLQQLLPGLDIVLTTSPREMMPMSLLEAMNAALPIIGAPHSGTLDLVVDGETGIVVKAWDARDFANAIEWATARPEWRKQAGEAAYARLVKNFNIEVVADKHVQLYNALLTHNKRISLRQEEVG